MKKIIMIIALVLAMATSAYAAPISVGTTEIKGVRLYVYLLDDYKVDKNNMAIFTIALTMSGGEKTIAIKSGGDLGNYTLIPSEAFTLKGNKVVKYEKLEPKLYKVNNDYMKKAFDIMKGVEEL